MFRPPDEGRKHYLKGEITLTLHIPKRAPTCQRCDLCKSDYDYKTHRCAATDESLINFDRERGVLCPIPWEDYK